MEAYDDDTFDDGVDVERAARGVRAHLWRRLFAYARPYRGTLAVLVGAGIVTAVLDVCFPLITRAVVDAAASEPAPALLPYAWLYAGCVTAFAASILTFIHAGGRLRAHLSHDIRRDGFANLQRLSFAFYDRRPVGWLMARMTSDCERLSNILTWGVLDLFWGATMMAGIALAMLLMNPRLALVVLAIVPVLMWVSGRFQKRILRSARDVRRQNSRITGAYNEGITGVVTTKAFVREAANAGDFTQLTSAMYRASVANQVQAAVYVPVVLTLAGLATGMTLVAGGIDLAAGLVSTGTLIAFLTYARHFFDPVEQLGRWFAELQMAQASAERVLSLVDARPDIADDAGVRAAIAAQARAPAAGAAIDGGGARIGEIELRDVGFAYDPAQPVLHHVNLHVRAGQTVALVGPTGGGKSTLVSLVCRFYEPTTGCILVDGVDYRRRSLHWLQSNLGIVLQSSHVFSGSIRENIRYGRLDASDAEVAAAARTAGAEAFISALPGGFDYDVGEGGSRLSAGQKQLLSFARAILADPQVLVMDEATSSVDTETEQHIQRGLARLLAGRIAFVIAHRLSTIRNADRIVVLAGGRIVESGSHDELVARRGHYFSLYRQQSLQESTSHWPSGGSPRPGA
jgi:ATP-binding cassette subfamily B protein